MKRTIILCALVTSFILIFSGCTDKKQIQEPTSKSDESKASLSTKQEEIKNQKDKDDDKKQEEAKKIATLLDKKKYIEKLDNIELGLKELAPKYAGSMADMKSAESETYTRWDSALNEIYGVLKQGLTPEEMGKLKTEQINWITYRDNTAEKAASEFKGGTMEGLEYTANLSRLTKERCYELVEKYMK